MEFCNGYYRIAYSAWVGDVGGLWASFVGLCDGRDDSGNDGVATGGEWGCGEYCGCVKGVSD